MNVWGVDNHVMAYIVIHELCYDQNFNENYYPHNSSSFLCCENCGGPHESFQCQSMNQNYFDHNPFYEPNSSSFDQFQPPQYSDVHQPPKEIKLYCLHNDVEDLIGSALNSKLLSINLKSQHLDKEKLEVKNIIEQPTKRRTRITESLQNFRIIHKKSSISLNNMTQISSVIAIAPDLPTEEPEYSLSMGDEHLISILETESDEVIKSSVEDLVPIPSESEVTSDNESECNVPVNDESSPIFTTSSNHLFDCNDDFTSSDDKSLSNEDIPIENFKIYSNPLIDDEEIISPKIDPHYFNAESNLFESLLNRDTLIDSSPKFDFLLEEFSGELIHIDPIPPGIEEADLDLEEEIRLVENLLYDNSSPQLSKELNAEITDTIFESLSPSPITVEDSNSQMEEIDLFLATYDLMPLGIENPSFPRPHPEPPDVEVFFKPDPGVSTTKVVKEIPSGEIKVHIEVLSVLWGNRLPIWTVRGRCLEEVSTARRKFPLPEEVPTEFALLVKIILSQRYINDSQRVTASQSVTVSQSKNHIQDKQKKKMIKTSSSSENEPCCSKDCKKNTKTLNTLAQVESRLVEYKEREVKYIEKIRTLEFYDKGKMECIETLKKELETLKQEKDVVDGKLAGLLKSSKDLENLIESQRSDKIKDGLGYNAIPPPIAQLYISPKKDLSWTGLPKCADDTVTDYSRPSPTVETERSTSNKVEAVKKPSVRYAELYRKPSKKSTVRGNQQNWNNLKSQQLGQLRDKIKRLDEDKKKQRNKKLAVSEAKHQVWGRIVGI
nr:hypothetical protein [Tanacetum cinerariifolium]